MEELHRNDRIDKNMSDSVQDRHPTAAFAEFTENNVVQVEITQVMNASPSRMVYHSRSVHDLTELRKCSCWTRPPSPSSSLSVALQTAHWTSSFAAVIITAATRGRCCDKLLSPSSFTVSFLIGTGWKYLYFESRERCMSHIVIIYC